MSLTETKQQIENLFDACTDNSDKIAGVELLEKINKELEAFFLYRNQRTLYKKNSKN